MNTFFTSDSHFGHSRIIEYCNRPFQSADEMNKTQIDNWNEIITDDDIVYHLGDFAFGSDEFVDYIIDQLNFKHLHFIKGNHDKPFVSWYKKTLAKNNKLSQYVSLYDSYHEVRINGIDFTLNHYAQRVWNKSHHGAFHLYGHSHGTLPDDPNSLSFDCGVDCHSYRPISFERVKEIMEKKRFLSVDHHGKEK
jgi:calcineurin-like phosphoesterase family protein